MRIIALLLFLSTVSFGFAQNNTAQLTPESAMKLLGNGQWKLVASTSPSVKVYPDLHFIKTYGYTKSRQFVYKAGTIKDGVYKDLGKPQFATIRSDSSNKLTIEEDDYGNPKVYTIVQLDENNFVVGIDDITYSYIRYRE